MIHLSKEAGSVRQTTLEEIRDGRCQVWVVASPTRYGGREIVARARSKLRHADYDLFNNNGEHFCTWCRSGRAVSTQVARWLSG